MKTAYRISWYNYSITKEDVPDDWSMEKHREEEDWLLWDTFENAKQELISGLSNDLDGIESLNEESYFEN